MKTTVQIQNLKCAGCESTIAKKLHSLENISNISVDTQLCTVSFNYESDEGLNAVKNTLTKLGYPLAEDANSIGKKAKSYVSCAIGRLNG